MIVPVIFFYGIRYNLSFRGEKVLPAAFGMKIHVVILSIKTFLLWASGSMSIKAYDFHLVNPGSIPSTKQGPLIISGCSPWSMGTHRVWPWRPEHCQGLREHLRPSCVLAAHMPWLWTTIQAGRFPGGVPWPPVHHLGSPKISLSENVVYMGAMHTWLYRYTRLQRTNQTEMRVCLHLPTASSQKSHLGAELLKSSESAAVQIMRASWSLFPYSEKKNSPNKSLSKNHHLSNTLHNIIHPVFSGSKYNCKSIKKWHLLNWRGNTTR